jgi:hypothetical protein
MIIEKFLNFRSKKLSKKDIFINDILRIADYTYIIFDFRFKNDRQSEKANTEEDLINCIDANKISYDGCRIMDIKKNDYIKNSFELTLTLTGLFDKFIRGDVEYNKYLSMSTRTHFSGKAMQVYNTYTSEYTDRGVNTSGYSKKLEVLFMSLEEFNIRYTDVEIDQNVSKEIEYWPYVRIKIKVDNEKLEKLINLVWDDDIKIPPLSQSSSLSRGRSYR